MCNVFFSGKWFDTFNYRVQHLLALVKNITLIYLIYIQISQNYVTNKLKRTILSYINIVCKKYINITPVSQYQTKHTLK